jgi:hypothetical protein
MSVKEVAMNDLEKRAKASGFTLVHEGPTCWYALLPGETAFRHVERRDGSDEMNYIGFFRTKEALLAELQRILEGQFFTLPSSAKA